MRGQTLGFVALLCATWIAGRIGFTLMGDSSVRQGKGQIAAFKPSLKMSRQDEHPAQIGNDAKRDGTFQLTESSRPFSPLPNNTQDASSRPNHSMIGQVEALDITVPNQSITDIPSSEGIASEKLEPSEEDRRLHPVTIYAYSFLRRGDAVKGMLGNGQYGGSQSGLLIAIPLRAISSAKTGSHLALAGRASISHSNMPDRELAAGLRWQLPASLSAHVIMERRFRQNKPDAYSAFVAGGHDGMALPMGFLLDGYGQAGVVTGEDGGVFADVQLTAHKPLVEHIGATLATGAGVWAGGQDRLMRIDIGPSIRAKFPLGGAHLRVDASWRFRIAGHAQPGSGPAVTLSTSF